MSSQCVFRTLHCYWIYADYPERVNLFWTQPWNDILWLRHTSPLMYLYTVYTILDLLNHVFTWTS